MPKRLRPRIINRVSFCEKGINPGAEVEFFKTRDDVQKATKTEDGEAYPASAFAYTPDKEKPSSWKLRLWESPSKRITARQVGRAVAALGPRGFRGNRVQIPADALAGVKRKVLNAWLKADPDRKREDAPRVLKALLGIDVVEKQDDEPQARSFDEIRTDQRQHEIIYALQDRLNALSTSIAESLAWLDADDAEKQIKESVGQFSSAITDDLAGLMAGTIVKMFTEAEEVLSLPEDLRDQVARLLSKPKAPEGDGGIDMSKIDLTKVPEDIRGQVEKAIAAGAVAGDLYKKLCGSNLKIEQLQADVEKIKKTKGKDDGDGKDDITKGMTDEQLAAFKKSEAEASALKTRVDVMEKRERRTEIKKRVSKFSSLAKSEEELVDVLEPLPDDIREKVEALLGAAHEAAKRGGLLTEVGTTAAGASGSAYAKMEAAAKAVQEKDAKLSREQAIAKVMQDQPALYEEYLREQH